MQNDKQLDSEVVRNADYEVFLTSGAPGYLEYAGTAQGRHVTIDADKGDLVPSDGGPGNSPLDSMEGDSQRAAKRTPKQARGRRVSEVSRR